MIYMQELNNLFSVDHLLLIIIDLIVHIDPNIILYTGCKVLRKKCTECVN